METAFSREAYVSGLIIWRVWCCKHYAEVLRSYSATSIVKNEEFPIIDHRVFGDCTLQRCKLPESPLCVQNLSVLLSYLAWLYKQQRFLGCNGNGNGLSRVRLLRDVGSGAHMPRWIARLKHISCFHQNSCICSLHILNSIDESAVYLDAFTPGIVDVSSSRVCPPMTSGSDPSNT